MQERRIEVSRTVIDAHVGVRIRNARHYAGLTLRELGARIGISQGQVHKFECGKNRVSVGVLYEISQVLNLPISYFFAELNRQKSVASDQRLSETVQKFSEIRKEKHQEAFNQLVRALSQR